MIRAVLLDVEGTTTRLSFVRDVLFPWAESRLPELLRDPSPEVARWLDEARAMGGVPGAGPDTTLSLLRGWMAEDRKLAPLKALQGHLWASGYRSGALQGHVYDDVPPALARWTAAGLTVAVFSSGSVDAQRLLFAHSTHGDLTPHLTAHFDTRTGSKQDAEAYRCIAGALGCTPPDMHFLSDAGSELDAAGAAGMRATRVVREGGAAEGPHPVARTFDWIGG